MMFVDRTGQLWLIACHDAEGCLRDDDPHVIYVMSSRDVPRLNAANKNGTTYHDCLIMNNHRIWGQFLVEFHENCAAYSWEILPWRSRIF